MQSSLALHVFRIQVRRVSLAMVVEVVGRRTFKASIQHKLHAQATFTKHTFDLDSGKSISFMLREAL